MKYNVYSLYGKRTHRFPRVSIGLPVYYGENFIDEAISSLVSKTFNDFELIITDDALTDRTQEICKRWVARDKRIVYYRNEVNLGAGRKFNWYFERSRGDYFNRCLILSLDQGKVNGKSRISLRWQKKIA